MGVYRPPVWAARMSPFTVNMNIDIDINIGIQHEYVGASASRAFPGDVPWKVKNNGRKHVSAAEVMI